MSCSLDLFGYIHDWKEIKDFLDDENEQADETDWSNDWDFEDSSNNKTTAKTANYNDNSKSRTWLQSCTAGYSPMADVFVVGKQSKAVFLLGNWDDKGSQMKYETTFKGVLGENEGELVTALACVPLISKKTSSPGSPDWTCILVGFSTGHVRMYTETGLLLQQQQFHNEPVKSFKLKSYKPASNPLEHDQLEELIVLYDKTVVTLDGFEVFQTLRGCRSHLARLKANTVAVASPAPHTTTPPLTFKKWVLEKVDRVADCDLTELKTPSMFDHLYNGSILGGIQGKCSPSPGSSSEFVTTGKNPFVSFQYAQEKSRAPVLADIAYSMANSLVNVATDWWRSRGSSSTQKGGTSPMEEKQGAPIDMMCRFGLRDSERAGTRLAISPCRKYTAVADSFGRVILFDNTRGLAVRMWKGYREAECAWLVVPEETKSSSSRKATFLVIYARTRGLLEVYSIEETSKLATFNISKNGVLLSATHGMMGVNDTPPRSSATNQLLQTLFVDEDARLYTLTIPFHFALEKSNSKFKDTHLLKSLNQNLKHGGCPNATILEILSKMQGESAITQALRLLTKKCDYEQLGELLDEYKNACGQLDLHSGRAVLLSHLRALLDFYEILYKSYAPLKSNLPEDEADLELLVQMTEKETTSLLDLWKKACTIDDEHEPPFAKRSVRFEETEEILTSKEFFTCCNVEPSKSTHNSEIRLYLSSKHMERFGQLLLNGCFNGKLDVFKWGEILGDSKLHISDLVKVTFGFWVKHSSKLPYPNALNVLYEILRTFCQLEGYQRIGIKFNEFSEWWEEIREEISGCSELFEIYSFALCCRSVSIEIAAETEKQANVGKETKEELDSKLETIENIATEWESMPLEVLKWNILLKQIEDLCILSEVIILRPKIPCDDLPVLHQVVVPLSATSLLEKGRGGIAETVAKWLSTIGINPQLIGSIDAGTNETVPIPDDKEKEEEASSANGAKEIVDHVKILLDNFQVSLSPSIILANYSWEYCLEWIKANNRTDLLHAALSCISCISSPLIQQGMFSLVWHKILLEKFKETITEFGNRTEKYPSFTSYETRSEFFNLCVSFLRTFMSIHRDRHEPDTIGQIDVKGNHWSNAAGPTSLVDLALSQPQPFYESICLHYKLVDCAHLLHVFQIRKPSLTPINLFDTQSRLIFFQNMSNEVPSLSVDVDLALKIRREEFLCLVIAGAINSIPEELCSTGEKGTSISDPDSIADCDKWIERCFELGRMWGLDLDVLRISQVCEYYSNGLDFLGEQGIPAIRGKDVLGAKLLVIAGMRVSYLINQDSASVPEMLSSVSTNLSNWLDNLDYSALKRVQSTKECISGLAQQVIQLIPESSYDFKLAEELLHSSSFL